MADEGIGSRIGGPAPGESGDATSGGDSGGGGSDDDELTQQEKIDKAFADSDVSGSERVDDPTTEVDESVNQNPNQGPFPDQGPAGGNPNVAPGDVNLPDTETGDLTDELADGNLTRDEVVQETQDKEAPGPTGGREERLQGPLGDDPTRQDVPGVEQESGKVALQARRLEEQLLSQSERLDQQQDVRVIRENGRLATRLTESGRDAITQSFAERSPFSQSDLQASDTGDVSLTERGETTQAREQVETIGRNFTRVLSPAARDARLAGAALQRQVQRAEAEAEAEAQAKEQVTQQVQERFGPTFQAGEEFRVETNVNRTEVDTSGDVNARALSAVDLQGGSTIETNVELTEEGYTKLAERKVREQYPGVSLTPGEDYIVDRDPDGFEIQINRKGREKIRESRSEEEFGDIPEIAGVKVDDELRGAGDAVSENVIEPVGGATGEFVGRATRGAAGLGRLAAGKDPTELSETTAVQTQTVADTSETFTEGGLQIFNVPSTTAGLIEAGEFIGKGVETTAVGDAVEGTDLVEGEAGQGETIEEFSGRAGEAGEQAVSGFATEFQENPFRTGGMLAGSLVASYAGIAGASRVSGSAGRATAYAVQPGEELAGLAGNQALTRAGGGITRVGRAVPGRAGSGVRSVGRTVKGSSEKLFPDNEPVFLSEETGIRVAKSAGRRLGRAKDTLQSGDLELQGSPRQQQIVESLRPGSATGEIEQSGEPRQDVAGAQSEQLGSSPEQTLDNLYDAQRFESQPEGELEGSQESTPEQRIVGRATNQRVGELESGVFGEIGRRVNVRNRVGAGLVPPEVEIDTESESRPVQEPEVDPTRQRDDILQGSPRDRLSEDITSRQLELRRQAEGTFEQDFDPVGEIESRTETAQEAEARLDQESRLDARTEPRVGPLQDTQPAIGQLPFTDIRGRPQTVADTDVDTAIEPVQELEQEQETEQEQELEQELEQEFEQETEFRRELEQEQEQEVEAELEAETENRLEAFTIDNDNVNTDQSTFAFGGDQEAIITNFRNPLTGETIQTDADPNRSVSDLFNPN